MPLARSFLPLGALLGAALGCSFLAPPDSETVGTRPTMAAGGSGASGASGAGGSSGSAAMAGEAGSSTLGEAGANSEPDGPVDVGTPTGAWSIPKGALLTSWGSNVRPSDVLRDYPRPQLVRGAWASLNGLWDYALRSQVDAQPASWDGKILVPFPIEAPLSGLGVPLTGQGQLWYHRSFEMPAGWRQRRLLLHFGAVDFASQVFVNGQAVGDHRGGYDAFTFDVTDQLVAATTQEIVVAVTDPTDSGGQPRGKQSVSAKLGSLTQVSGIWQSVWLEPVATTHIEDVTIVPSAAAGTVAVKANLAGTVTKGATLSVTISEGGTQVANAEGPAASTLTLHLSKPKLWSPASPTLYDLSFIVTDESGVVDAVQSYVGLRDITMHADAAGVNRIFLNDEPVFQLGVIDQGNWPDGLYTAPSDEAVQTDISRAKQLGFVALRKHQKIEPDRFYYWCDKLGLLVWQDMPMAGNTSNDDQTEFETELSALVTQHLNHPSIVAWDLFYFGAGQFDPPGLTNSVKALDPTRLVDAISGFPDDGSGDVRDRPDFARASSPAASARAALLGAFGSLSQGVDGHVWHPTATFGYDPSTAIPLATDSYQELIASAWGLNAAPGLSGAMFRQLTDVEGELDGLFTYDRAFLKFDSQRLQKLNSGQLDAIYTLLETSDMAADPRFTPSGASSYAQERHRYRFTSVDPGTGWEQPGFDDSGWTEAPAGFGYGVSGATMATLWTGANIWIRGSFAYDGPLTGSAYLRTFHNDDVWAYVNGNLAANLVGLNSHYQDVLVSDAAQRSLKAGKGTIAARCINRGGSQFLDVGLVERAEGPTLLDATLPASTTPGAIFARYDATSASVPTFSSLTPNALGLSSTLTLDVAAPATVNYSLQFAGFIDAPRDGLYTFSLQSDDNSLLSIDGTPLVSVSGGSALEYSGNIGLKAGKHAFTLGYVQLTGPASLQVSWAGPGFSKQSIGASSLSHAVQQADTVVNALTGVAFSQYNGTFPSVPDFSTLTANLTGTSPTLTASAASIPNYYALKFTGYLDVPKAGVYALLLSADDGAKLWLDDAVIDDDGTHALTTVSGNVALTLGKHAFTLGYHQRGSVASLDLSWIGPGIPKQTIPASALFH